MKKDYAMNFHIKCTLYTPLYDPLLTHSNNTYFVFSILPLDLGLKSI